MGLAVVSGAIMFSPRLAWADSSPAPDPFHELETNYLFGLTEGVANDIHAGGGVVDAVAGRGSGDNRGLDLVDFWHQRGNLKVEFEF